MFPALCTTTQLPAPSPAIELALPYGKTFKNLAPVAHESVLRQISSELTAITVERPAEAVETQAAMWGPTAVPPKLVSAVSVQLPELAASAYDTTSPVAVAVHHTNHLLLE